MNKQARVEALRQTIMHTIKGEHELAEALFKAVATASSRRIVMGESNYSLDDDPEFDARRELQRELEDDLADGGLEGELDGADGDVDGLDCEAGGDCEVIDAIVAKLEDGEVDDATLAQILNLLVDEEGGEEGPEGLDGIEGGEEGGLSLDLDAGGVGDEDLAGGDIEDPAKLEAAAPGGASGSLFDKIKFALRYEYDQFLDCDGQPEEWPEFALIEPGVELSELLSQIPADLKSKYDAAIKQFIDSQVK